MQKYKKEKEKMKQNKNSKYFYADDYQEDTKKQNPLYSNVLNRELGKKTQQNKNLSKILPSVSYQQYKKQIKTKSPELNENENDSKRYENLIRQLSVKNDEPNIETEYQKKQFNKDKSAVFIKDYTLKMDKRKLDEIELKHDFVNNGFHVVTLNSVQDPVNQKKTGVVNLRMRMDKETESDFDDFLKFKQIDIKSSKKY